MVIAMNLIYWKSASVVLLCIYKRLLSKAQKLFSEILLGEKKKKRLVERDLFYLFIKHHNA